MRKAMGVTLVAAIVGVAPLAAQGISNLQISGNQVTATVSLAGGISADLELTFEQASGLSASSLGLSAQLVTPTSLLTRLPSGVSLLSAFPVVVRIEPPATGGLSFTGIATLALHTSNLDYVQGTTLRLFKAPVGGSFVEVTDWMGSGSYRVRGSTGGFSEFAIAADTQRTADVVDAKYAALASLLQAASLPTALADELAGLLASSRDAWLDHRPQDAVADLDDFASRVEEESGGAIANVWRAARDLDDTAGKLRAAAATLRFSLGL